MWVPENTFVCWNWKETFSPISVSVRFLKFWPGSVRSLVRSVRFGFGFLVNRATPLQYRFFRKPLTNFDRLFQFGLVFGLPCNPYTLYTIPISPEHLTDYDGRFRFFGKPYSTNFSRTPWPILMENFDEVIKTRINSRGEKKPDLQPNC